MELFLILFRHTFYTTLDCLQTGKITMYKSDPFTHTLWLEKPTHATFSDPGYWITSKYQPAPFGQNQDSVIEKRAPSYTARRDEIQDFDRLITGQSQAYYRAEALYRAVRFAGQISILLSWLVHRPDHLIDASQILPNSVDTCQDKCLQIVPIKHIVASLGESHNFDSAFNPLQDRYRSRWTDIAAHWLLGDYLPPVELIQVQKVYIVHDGHQRISVACALGQDDIEANVMLVM